MVLATFLVKSLLDCALVCVTLSKCKVFLYNTARCTLLDTPSRGTDLTRKGGRCYQHEQGIPGPICKSHTFGSCTNASVLPSTTRRSRVFYQETKYFEQCKYGGTYFQAMCYMFVYRFEDLETAQESCMNKGMNLLTDVSEKTTKFLTRFLKDKSWKRVWTAGVYGGNGIWIWKKTQVNEIIEYKNWSPGHPPDKASGSGIAWNTTTSTWEAVIATEKFEYVCETRWPKLKFAAELEDGNYNLKGDCEGGGKYFNGSCYLYVRCGTTWDSGRSFCEDRQMSLLEITSAEEMGFVAFYMKFVFAEYVQCHWIGLSDRNNTGQWFWTGSSTRANYTNWQARQPDGGTFLNRVQEDCVAMYCDDMKTWHDFPCDDECDFVCEFNAMR